MKTFILIYIVSFIRMIMISKRDREDYWIETVLPFFNTIFCVFDFMQRVYYKLMGL